MKNKKINVGIGFATGRKNFQKVLRTHVDNWKESGLTELDNISLNLFVAYDLEYSNTKPIDYTNVDKDILDMLESAYFISDSKIDEEIEYLLSKNILDESEADLFFCSGYAAKRNAVLYFAIKNKIDYLLFLDDDEYPLAVTNTKTTSLWGGQDVLSTHLRNIRYADITNGHHCGYISPIPYIEFNQILDEKTFRTFIEAISNDIINWDTIRSVMKDGGVTYADTKILTRTNAPEVEEINGAKFISGSNLCLNLTNCSEVKPFYNPPNARGEDTFLSTCLSDKKVLRVPCYTFHDGFGAYGHIMNGVLPIKLKSITADSEAVIDRFYKACIGWIRYKPLFTFITDRENYEKKIHKMKKQIDEVLPSICNYFERDEFMNIKKELDYYDEHVVLHHSQFIETQNIWSKICKELV
jgi:hypothetical protein